MNSTTLEERITKGNARPKGQRLLVAVRSLTMLALALWIGGMAFFGAMAAPVLFRLSRQSRAPELGPRMVGDMLARFGFLTTICGVLLVLGWAADGALSRSTAQRLWKVQGALSVLCLGLSLYLSGVLLPRTQAQQAEILPLYVRGVHGEVLSADEVARKARFDAGHEAYKRLASLICMRWWRFWLSSRRAAFRPWRLKNSIRCKTVRLERPAPS